MTEFKRTAGNLASSLVAAFGGGMLTLILWAAVWRLNAGAWVASAAVTALVAVYLVRSENIRLVIEEGEFFYYQGGELAQRFALGDYAFTSRVNSPGFFTPFRMAQIFVQDEEGTRLAAIDCSALGARQCEQLFALLKQYAKDYTEELDPRSRRRLGRPAERDAPRDAGRDSDRE